MTTEGANKRYNGGNERRDLDVWGGRITDEAVHGCGRNEGRRWYEVD